MAIIIGIRREAAKKNIGIKLLYFFGREAALKIIGFLEEFRRNINISRFFSGIVIEFC